jgi:hypothetical protein
MLFEENFAQQATMFQPVGGMDRIAAAFAKKLGLSVNPKQLKRCLACCGIRQHRPSDANYYVKGDFVALIPFIFHPCMLPPPPG